jgi:hypothetical protein
MRMFVCLQESKKTSTKTTFALLYNMATIFSWRVSLPSMCTGAVFIPWKDKKRLESRSC